MQPSVPAVEVAHDAYRARARGPDGEGDPRDAVDLPRVRAEDALQLLVATFAGKVEIELAHGGEERVRVAEADLEAVGVLHFDPVVDRRSRVLHRALVDAGRMDAAQAHRALPVGSH